MALRVVIFILYSVSVSCSSPVTLGTFGLELSLNSVVLIDVVFG